MFDSNIVLQSAWSQWQQDEWACVGVILRHHISWMNAVRGNGAESTVDNVQGTQTAKVGMTLHSVASLYISYLMSPKLAI